MTAEFGNTLKEYIIGILEFVARAPGDKDFPVSYFPLLEKDLGLSWYWGYFAIFPPFPLGREDRSGYIAYSSDATREEALRPYVSKILSLTLPERLKALNLQEDREIRSLHELGCLIRKWPSIVLAVGNTVGTDEEVLTIFCVPGITPDQAVKELQEKTRDVIASYN